MGGRRQCGARGPAGLPGRPAEVVAAAGKWQLWVQACVVGAGYAVCTSSCSQQRSTCPLECPMAEPHSWLRTCSVALSAGDAPLGSARVTGSSSATAILMSSSLPAWKMGAGQGRGWRPEQGGVGEGQPCSRTVALMRHPNRRPCGLTVQLRAAQGIQRCLRRALVCELGKAEAAASP